MTELWLPVPPRVKSRPRLNRKTGQAFTPKPTKLYEAAIREAWTGPLLDGPVSVEIVYHRDGQWVTVTNDIHERTLPRGKGDLDNYIKATLDGLNGTAWTDDSQVMTISASFKQSGMPG